jgi:hypothetical protein
MGVFTTLSRTALSSALAAAAPGAVLTAELYPVVGVGKIRVTYNWLYSALNCDPTDDSAFVWVINKTPDGTVTLSPQETYSGAAWMTLYASVRPDWDSYVQVQAPNSADWITGVGGDEQLTMTDLGFMTINLRGVNGQYLAVNSSISLEYIAHGSLHAGFKLQSNASAPGTSTNIFLAVTQNLQDGVALPLVSELHLDDIRIALQAHGASDAVTFAEKIAAVG